MKLISWAVASMKQSRSSTNAQYEGAPEYLTVDKGPSMFADLWVRYSLQLDVGFNAQRALSKM